MFFNLKKLAKKICVLGASALLTSSLSMISPVNAVNPGTKSGTQIGGSVDVGKSNITPEIAIPTTVFTSQAITYDGTAHDPFAAGDDKGIKGITVAFTNGEGDKTVVYNANQYYGALSGDNKVKLYIRKVGAGTEGVKDEDSEWIEISSDMTDYDYKKLFVTNPGTYTYYYYVDGADFFSKDLPTS